MFEKLFGNVGGKLKLLAKVWFCLTVIGGTIGGIVLVAEFGDDEAIGFILLFGSWLVGWLTSLPMYAFGQFVENTDKIDAKLGRLTGAAPTASEQKQTAKKLTELEQLLAAGVITEEEFNAKKAEWGN